MGAHVGLPRVGVLQPDSPGTLSVLPPPALPYAGSAVCLWHDAQARVRVGCSRGSCCGLQQHPCCTCASRNATALHGYWVAGSKQRTGSIHVLQHSIQAHSGGCAACSSLSRLLLSS
jgi:hypothetical protein